MFDARGKVAGRRRNNDAKRPLIGLTSFGGDALSSRMYGKATPQFKSGLPAETLELPLRACHSRR